MSFASTPMPVGSIGAPLLPTPGQCGGGGGGGAREGFSQEVECRQFAPAAQAAREVAAHMVPHREVQQNALAWGAQCQNGYCYAPMMR